MKGLIETDGHVGNEIYYHTTSKELAYQIRFLLMRFGVLASGYIKDDRGKTHKIRENELITKQKICYIIRKQKIKFGKQL